ncbi:phage terminase large subunit family protein [Gaopeijia maritima]|uniref:phage terminase large subunit family protein n=1 Tax=Gaopeijia maritima TaxID=3119007 RepID=UPI00327F2AA0
MQLEAVTAEAARDEWRRIEREIFSVTFAPRARLSPSEWAERHRVLTQGEERGRPWSNDSTPHLVEIMDFVGAPWARKGVVRKSARVGYTEGVIGNVAAWTIAMDPCPMAIIQPSDGEAEQYSKEQVSPLIQMNPEIRDRIGKMGSRSSDSTITYKEFAGGFLSILGSAADKNMRRRSFRRVFVDEVDGMKVDSKEGDPLLRIQKRTDDFEDGVMIVGSTPTTKHESRIDREFEKSDQRYRHLPCPHCDEYQVLEWGGPSEAHGIKWDRELFCRACGLEVDSADEPCPGCGAAPTDEDGRLPVEVKHLPETAHYVCYYCGGRIEESDKEAMARAARWIPTKPGAPFPGWQVDALFSLFHGARWSKLVQEFLDATENASDLQVWWNTVLGRAWEERTKNVELDDLEARAEEFVGPDGTPVDVPDGVGIITAAVDVQGSWLELLVRGWGRGERSWDILHERIHGDPEAAFTWARLEALLTRPYRHVNGRELHIDCAMIDAGAFTTTVYTFVKPRESRRVFAIIGDKTGSQDAPPLKRPSRSNADGVRVFTAGTFRLKDDLVRRLKIQTPGPRYIHLRSYNPDRCNGFDAEYFAQFEAEKKIFRRRKGSREGSWLWVQKRSRNEAIDLHVYNLAAFLALGVGVRADMDAWVEEARRPPEEDDETEREAGRQRSSWATSW